MSSVFEPFCQMMHKLPAAAAKKAATVEWRMLEKNRRWDVKSPSVKSLLFRHFADFLNQLEPARQPISTVCRSNTGHHMPKLCINWLKRENCPSRRKLNLTRISPRVCGLSLVKDFSRWDNVERSREYHPGLGRGWARRSPPLRDSCCWRKPRWRHPPIYARRHAHQPN